MYLYMAWQIPCYNSILLPSCLYAVLCSAVHKWQGLKRSTKFLQVERENEVKVVDKEQPNKQRGHTFIMRLRNGVLAEQRKKAGSRNVLKIDILLVIVLLQ